MGSKHAAWLMLSALHHGSAQDVRATIANLDKFIPPGSTPSECERRDLLEGLGAEVISHTTSRSQNACRSLLEHLAQSPPKPATLQ